MAGFENYAEEVRLLEVEIERRGIALGIDWDDTSAVTAIAREALDHQGSALIPADTDPQAMARLELRGLAGLMLRVMTKGAELNLHLHGGRAWKALGGALWREWKRRNP